MSAVRVGVEFDPFIQIFTNPYCGLVKLLVLPNQMDDGAQMITPLLQPPILEFLKPTAVILVLRPPRGYVAFNLVARFTPGCRDEAAFLHPGSS
jgi:hypothetical protein